MVLANGLYNSSRMFAKQSRRACEPYDVMEVVQAIKDWAATSPPNLDLAKLCRGGI